MSAIGTFETCRRALRMSDCRGRPEVTGRWSNRRDCPSADVALCDRFNAEKRFAKALWNFLICLKVEASSTSANSSQTWEKANDQIDRFCCLRLSRHNLSTGNDSCAGSRAGRHDHASRLRLRPVQDTSWWCLRRQDHHPPCAPRSPQVCAMARRRLRSVGLLKRLAASKLLFLRSGSALRQAQPRDGYLNLRNCGWPPLGYSEVRSLALFGPDRPR